MSRSWFVPDGPVAQTALVVWTVFVTSSCFLLACLPYLIFEVLVGWQPSHLALLLGSLTMAPVAPALCGLLVSTRAMVDGRGYPRRPAHRFYLAIRDSSPAQRQLWLALPVLVLFLAYDLALYAGKTPVVATMVALVGVLTGIVVIGGSTIPTPGQNLRGMLTTVLTSLARHPLLPLTWLFLLAAAVLLTRVPLLGPSLGLFLPGAWAAAVEVVNRFFKTRTAFGLTFARE